MEARNRIAEIRGRLLELELEIYERELTPLGQEMVFDQARGDVLYAASEIVLELEKYKDLLSAACASYFQLKHDIKDDDKHIEWLRGELKARDDEIISLKDKIYRQTEQMQKLRGFYGQRGHHGRS